MTDFGSLTPRMAKLRQDLLDAPASIDATHALWTTQVWKQYAAYPAAIRRARTLEKILKEMPLYIEPESLLAGSHAVRNRAAPIFPEYAMDWVIAELDTMPLRDGDAFQVPEEDKKILLDIYPFWKDRTVLKKGLALMPEESRQFYDLGIIKAEGNITSGDGHVAMDYKTILARGLESYRKETEEKLAALDMTQYDNMNAYHFLQGVLITLDAVKAFAKRYADLARTQAKDADDKRKAELLNMARTLERVPWKPAETFYEAVQSLWIIHAALQVESNGHSYSFGRLDQVLCPYYEKDVKNGLIDEEEAVELLVNLWLKAFSINKVRSWSHTQFSAGSPLYQNVTIAGMLPDGSDGHNVMSDLILKSVAQTRLTAPNLTVRYHKNMSHQFMQDCLAVMALGFGMPAFNSDEIIVPSFVEKGVKLEDARNYAAIGCVETAVPGLWGYRCTGMSFLNFPKSLLIAMNGGKDVESGTLLVPGLKPFTEWKDFDELMDAWEKTIRLFCRHSIVIENACDWVLEKEVPDVLCSALSGKCIERGKTLKEGGAVYDYISGLQVGIANLADSLAAVKSLVYEEHKLSADDLWQALMEDFQSEKGKTIQQMLLDAPKYGNDDPYVDLLATEAYAPYIDEMKKYPNPRFGKGPIGGIRYAGTSSISANVGQGMGTWATPDGRNAHEPLAEGCSPTHGMDTHGPTSVFKSVSRLPIHEITGGVLLNQKMSPALMKSDSNRTKLEMLLRTFFNRLEGYHVQYNIVDRQTLLDAQAHPEAHRDLIVRVAGYSAFFKDLSTQTQNDIIARTEQSL